MSMSWKCHEIKYSVLMLIDSKLFFVFVTQGEQGVILGRVKNNHFPMLKCINLKKDLESFFFNLFCVWKGWNICIPFFLLDTRNIGFLSFCPTVRTMRQIWNSCHRSTFTGCGMCTCWLRFTTPMIWRSLLLEESSIIRLKTSLENRL